MELNSTEQGSYELKEAPADLSKVIAESKAAVEEQVASKRGAGRPAKYSSDDERVAARRAQNRAYKAARRGGRPRPAGAPEDPQVIDRAPAVPVEEFRPAGMAPFLDPLADLPAQEMRDTFGLTREELPDLPAETKQVLVAQADLCIGIFAPNAANNKWVILGGFLTSCTVTYGSMFRRARGLALEKARVAAAAAQPSPGPSPSPIGAVFPSALA